MEDVTIGVYTLTTAHPASHYGIPTLVGPDGTAYGPADPVNCPETDALFGAEPFPAIRLVLGSRSAMTPEQRAGAYLYAQQWPEGYARWATVFRQD